MGLHPALRGWAAGPSRWDVPVEYGPWSRVYDLFLRWQRNGTWHRILTRLQPLAGAKGAIRWDRGVDSTVCRAHQYAAGARRQGDLQKEPSGGVLTEPGENGLGRCRGGFPTEWHLAVEQGQRGGGRRRERHEVADHLLGHSSSMSSRTPAGGFSVHTVRPRSGSLIRGPVPQERGQLVVEGDQAPAAALTRWSRHRGRGRARPAPASEHDASNDLLLGGQDLAVEAGALTGLIPFRRPRCRGRRDMNPRESGRRVLADGTNVHSSLADVSRHPLRRTRHFWRNPR